MFVNFGKLIWLSFFIFRRLFIKMRARSFIYRVAVFCDRLSKKMLLMLLLATKRRDW